MRDLLSIPNYGSRKKQKLSEPDNLPIQPLQPEKPERSTTLNSADAQERVYAGPQQAQNKVYSNPETTLNNPPRDQVSTYPAQKTIPAHPQQPSSYPAQPQYVSTPQYVSVPQQHVVYYHPAAPTHPAAKTNVLAIISLISGIAAFPLYLFWIGPLLSITSLVTGYIALPEIRRNGENGRGLALGGIITSWILLGIATITLLSIFVYIQFLSLYS